MSSWDRSVRNLELRGSTRQFARRSSTGSAARAPAQRNSGAHAARRRNRPHNRQNYFARHPQSDRGLQGWCQSYGGGSRRAHLDGRYDGRHDRDWPWRARVRARFRGRE